MKERDWYLTCFFIVEKNPAFFRQLPVADLIDMAMSVCDSCLARLLKCGRASANQNRGRARAHDAIMIRFSATTKFIGLFHRYKT